MFNDLVLKICPPQRDIEQEDIQSHKVLGGIIKDYFREAA